MPNDTPRQVAIEAKHLRPRLDQVSLRPDAVDLLGPAFERRLTVICAPAGYGKSTTTAAALERCGCSSSWYKLDILDHDPLAFLASMTRAVQRIHPGFGADLLRELESGPVTDLPVEVLAARFCSECDGLVSQDLHLVLDDYHEAMDSEALNSVLGYLLENCPGTIHFVVLTRYEPAFRLEKLHLAGEVCRVPRDLFMFTLEQVAEILAQRSGRRHDSDHVVRLHQLTEGWPASVVLAGMALAWLDLSSLEDALADPRLRGDVFSYLAEQVFQRQSEEVQRFLLNTCCLEHVTAGLAEMLTGSTNASRQLHYLARNHVFTFDTERMGAYRYHNLLRDFLRQQVVHDDGESAFRALQRRTAVALEDCGDLPAAVELLLAGNELELATAVVSRGGEALLERRPTEQLRLWVAMLSALLDHEEPWALVTSGVLAARESRFCVALEHLRRACLVLESADNARDLYQALSILEWAEFWSGDCAACIDTCSKALSYATTDDQRLHTLLSLLSAALDMRRWVEVDEASRRADSLLPGASAVEAARALALRAHAAYYRGDVQTALSLIPDNRDSRQSSAQLAVSLNTNGMIRLALGQYAAASQALESAASVARDFGQIVTSCMIEDNIAMLEAALGYYSSAEHRLSRLLARSSELDPTILCFVLTHQGTISRRKGNAKESIEPTERAIEAISMDRDAYLALNARVNLAFAEGLLGGDRCSQLLSLSSMAAASGVQFVELKATLYAALLEFALENKTAWIRLLSSCLPRQLALGHINFLAQELCHRPDVVIQLLKSPQREAIGIPLVSALVVSSRFSILSEKIRQEVPRDLASWIDNLQAPPTSGASHSAGEPSRDCRAPMLGDLTPREATVLRLMAANSTNSDIAAELYVALSTVKTHVNHILRKLGQTTRIGAILEYQRMIAQSPPGEQAGIHPRYDSNDKPPH